MAQYDPAFTPIKKEEKKYDPAFTPLKPEDYELSGVEFEKPKPKEEPKKDTRTFRFRGESILDPNADWWEKLKGVGELFGAVANVDANATGLGDVEKQLSKDIPRIPFVREAMKDFAEGMTFQGREAPKEGETAKRAWNEIVGGGIEGVGETLSDPRSYIMPKVFSELGRKSTWSAKDLEYWKGEYEKGRAPIQGGKATVLDPTHYPGKKTLEGSFDVEGVNALQSVTPRLPKRPSGGRFLASPSGTAGIRNTLPLVAGSQAGEFSPPLDPSDTSRFSRTLIEGTPSNVLPEGPLNREPTPPPPTPLAPSKLGMEGGRGPRFGRPVGGEQMPLIPTIEGELPSTTLDEPPPIGEPQARVPRGLIDPNRPGTEVAFTPEPRITPRFKNKERPLKPAPLKPTLRFTSDGQVIDTSTGEVTEIGPALDKISETQKEPELGIIKPPSDDILPQGMAKVGKDKIAIGYDKSLGQILATSLYQGNTGKIVVKELLQNSMDATRKLGTNGKIDITVDEVNHAVTVKDNGPGMTREELETYFTNLGASGKRSDVTAVGGFGLAKAAPLLGGTHVQVTSIAKRSNGKTYKTIFSGTPQDLLDETVGVDLTSVEVPAGTPTGFEVTTSLRDPGNSWQKLTGYDVRESMETLAGHSLGFEGTIGVDQIDAFSKGKTANRKEYAGLLSDPKDKIIPLSNKSADFDLVVPVGAQYGERTGVQVALLNNGMYQNTVNLGGYGTYPSVPDKILLNIKSKVPEGDPDYPFTANRENIRGTVMQDIQKYINDNIVKPGINARMNSLTRAYQNMIPTPYPARSGREFFIYDVGNTLSPDDLNFFVDHPINIKLADVMSRAVEEIMARMPQDWQDKLEKIGFITHNELYGIHIPNPAANASTGGEKSAILLNPWSRLHQADFDAIQVAAATGQHESPVDSAIAGLFHTIAHEIAHIPGGGHDESFAQRLAQVYAKVGADTAIDYQRQFGEILSDPRNRSQYAFGVQEILQRYNDTRGIVDVTKDPLYGTGISHAAPGKGQGGDALYRRSNGEGIARRIWDETGALGGAQPPRTPRVDRVSPRGTPPTEPTAPVDSAIKERMLGEGHLITRAMGLSKGLVATGDLAPLLRQGGYYAGRAFWRKAAVQQFRSYASEGGHQRAIDEMKRSTLFEKNREGKTVAERMKLQLNLGRRNWRNQEETMMGIEDAERLADFAFRGKINPVRASNRSFHDAVDTIRLGAAEGLRDNYRKFYLSLMKTAKTQDELRYAMSMNPDSDVVLQKIGEQVNQTSGYSKFGLKERRTPKDIRIPFTKKYVDLPKSIADKGILPEIDLDPVAGIFNLGLFSGRLAKSKIEQYNKVFNPYSYMKADPVMRREYLKQLLSMGASRVILTGLGAAMGGILGTVATQSNWGKSEMGPRNPRTGRGRFSMDTTMGGGKFETLFERLRQGQYTTAKGKTSDLGSGPYIPTGLDLVEGMGEGLASPTFRAALQILDKSEHFAGPQKPGQGVGLRTVTETMTPIIGQDLWDIIAEDPSYIPLLFPDAVGLGIQIDRSR